MARPSVAKAMERQGSELELQLRNFFQRG